MEGLPRQGSGERGKVMTLATDEFIRRFLIHVLPSGFHRIRHYGLFANGGRAENIARARQLLQRSRAAAAPRRHGPCGRRRAAILVSLPMLRRAHDHHRDIRAWLHTAASANPTHPDRQLVTIARHLTRSQLADIGGLPAGRTAPRSIHDHDLAVSRARDLTNMECRSLPHVGSATQATGNSGRARLQAANSQLSRCSNHHRPASASSRTSPRFPPSSLIGRPGRLPSGLFVRSASAGARGVR